MTLQAKQCLVAYPAALAQVAEIFPVTRQCRLQYGCTEDVVLARLHSSEQSHPAVLKL